MPYIGRVANEKRCAINARQHYRTEVGDVNLNPVPKLRRREVSQKQTRKFPIILDRDNGCIREGARGRDGESPGSRSGVHYPLDVDASELDNLDHPLDQIGWSKRDALRSACRRRISGGVLFAGAIDKSIAARGVGRNLLPNQASPRGGLLVQTGERVVGPRRFALSLSGSGSSHLRLLLPSYLGRNCRSRKAPQMGTPFARPRLTQVKPDRGV